LLKNFPPMHHGTMAPWHHGTMALWHFSPWHHYTMAPCNKIDVFL